MTNKSAYIKKVTRKKRYYREPLIPANAAPDPVIEELLKTKEFVDREESDSRYYANKKLKICGNIIELREYEEHFGIGPRIKGNTASREHTKEKVVLTEEQKAEASSRRARNKLIDHVNCNVFAWLDEHGRPYHPIFLTLTFAENLTDVTKANYEFTKFIRRFNYLVTGTKQSYLKYVAVIEFQDRGAAHFHIILFNLPFIERIIDKVRTIWPDVFDIEGVKNARNVGRYVCKYIYKGFARSTLEKGRKLYFCSRGLKKPIIVYHDELINPVISQLPQQSLEKENKDIKTEYLGNMNMRRYNLTQYPAIHKTVLAFLDGNV